MINGCTRRYSFKCYIPLRNYQPRNILWSSREPLKQADVDVIVSSNSWRNLWLKSLNIIRTGLFKNRFKKLFGAGGDQGLKIFANDGTDYTILISTPRNNRSIQPYGKVAIIWSVHSRPRALSVCFIPSKTTVSRSFEKNQCTDIIYWYRLKQITVV